MTEEEVQYYWDEDTQTYYYWDEESQAFYPWVDPAANEQEYDAPVAEIQEAPSVSVLEEPLAQVEPAEAPSFVDYSAAEPQSAPRSTRRRYSFAEHGGLAGCIQLANAERLQRQDTLRLTDEEIKLEQQKARIRDLLQETGLLNEASALQVQNGDTPPPNALKAGSAAQKQRALATSGILPSAVEAKEVFGNARRAESGRRSSVRFGTAQFNDPNFQPKLEAMLGSQVKK